MEFLVDTDIITNHLTHEDRNSRTPLETAMMKGICFTSAINVSELFYAARTPEEKECVEKVVYALKVLGINSRYALNICDFSGAVASSRDALFCSVAKNNKIPILTDNAGRYSGTGIQIITSQELSG